MTGKRASDPKDLNILEYIVKSNIDPLSGYIYGFADLMGLLPGEFSRFSVGLSIGKRLDDQIVDPVINGPTPEYYHHFKQANYDLEKVSEDIAGKLSAQGIGCIAIVPSMPLSGEEFRPYLKDLRYKLSHKMVATRAGLGWIGKTGLFVSEAFGPRLRLVSILIESTAVVAATPTEVSKCGSCNICVRQCPAQAANGITWNIHIDRDEFFNAHKCREKCLAYGRSMFGKEVGVCGICIAVCPQGQSN
jgi:epoxyqueuosine reductase QueG